MDALIQASGQSGEVVRFGLALLSSFPLSALFPLIRSTFLRHLFSFISSGLITSFVFRISAFVELLALCLGVYVLASTFGNKSYGPVLIFTAALAHMAYLHLENQVWRVDDDKYIDYSSMMMVLLIKLSSFGWNIYDASKTGSKAEKLDSYQREVMLAKFPSLVEFLGYCFFINGVWVGPAIEFNHYLSFVEAKKAPYEKPPKALVPALKCLGAGILTLIAENLIGPHFHFQNLGKPIFLQLPLYRKVFFITISGMIVRAKFYTVWKISEASALISGVGVRLNKKGEHTFDAFENINIWQLETGENVKACWDGWNKFTAIWLRRYIYVRVPIPALCLPVTFFISAFWHGFYPGYYLSFLFSVPLTECARTMRRVVRPVFLPGGAFSKYKLIYDVLGNLVTLFCLNYLFLCFVVRRMDLSFQAWNHLYFLGHALFLLPIVLLDVFGLKKFIKPFHPDP